MWTTRESRKTTVVSQQTLDAAWNTQCKPIFAHKRTHIYLVCTKWVLSKWRLRDTSLSGSLDFLSVATRLVVVSSWNDELQAKSSRQVNKSRVERWQRFPRTLFRLINSIYVICNLRDFSETLRKWKRFKTFDIFLCLSFSQYLWLS